MARLLTGLMADAKFRMKLFVSYFLLVSLVILVLGFVYYRISARNLLLNVQESLGNVVYNNNQLLDEKLRTIRDKSDVLPIDNELYRIIMEVNPADNESLLKADKRITQILFQYFGGDSDLYSSFILTRYYAFGNGARMFVPPDGFFHSELYRRASKGLGDLVWIPAYSFAETFGDPELHNLGFEYSRLISAVKELNLTYIDDEGSFHTLPGQMERPVLMVNLTPEYLEKLFSDYAGNSGYRDLSYGMIDADGTIVMNSDDRAVSGKMLPAWFGQTAGREKGSLRTVQDGRDMLVSFSRIKTTGWISYIELPVREGLRGLAALKFFSALFLAAMLGVSLLLALLMSVFITRPIIGIKKAMKLLERGQFHVRIPEQGRDELGQLTRLFNQMSGRIQTLIEENYASRLREKEAELMALNLQLNPHFLYNTLTTMYWIAVENGQEEISRIMRYLAEMLQTSTRSKSETWSLATDLEWLEKYIYIMSSRFESMFAVRFEVEESLRTLEVPKLFLQPFVENAIIHGFAEREGGGEIVIRGYRGPEGVVFEVEDNGAGIAPERLEELKAGAVPSTGIANVDKRIRLLYGPNGGIGIESAEGLRTRITIRMGEIG